VRCEIETKSLKLVIVVIALAGLGAVSLYFLLGLGLGYERAVIHAKQSFIVDKSGSVTFRGSDTHVLEYVVGKRPSRMTTAHGYEDRILIEFRDNPHDPSGDCTLLRGARVGYRRGGTYRLRSPEDLWVKIRRCGDHYHAEGAVKITLVSDEGKFDPGCWEVVVIEPQEIEASHSADHERQLPAASRPALATRPSRTLSETKNTTKRLER